MPCYKPLQAFRSKSGPSPITGKWPIVFKINQGLLDDKNILKVPCGQCIGCRLEKSKKWAIRCMHEASLYKKNCFLTLTYNKESYEKNLKEGSLNKIDFVRFMKGLRANHGKGIRFFHCGEYGEKYGRAHHHTAIFNFYPEDAEFKENRKGVPLYQSIDLNRIWGNGNVVIGNLTFESAAYIARYVTKKITGIMQDFAYGKSLPPYQTMSLRPGIARGWLEQYGSDCYPSDKIIMRGTVVGHPPRYYDNIYDKAFPGELEKLKTKRREKIDPNEQKSARLLTRMELKKLTMKKWSRDYD